MYKPTDTLFLWFLGLPNTPRLVGRIHLIRKLKGVSLEYAPTWIQSGFPLSEDLPLLETEFLPQTSERAAGAVDDARPDRWGERIIKMLNKLPRQSILEMLYFAGDERFGALGVSTSEQDYLPARLPALPQLDDVESIHQVIRAVLAKEEVDERLRRLIAPGVTLGGARPKALVNIDGMQWVLKFAEEDHSFEPLYEHAAMVLARHAGINAAETRPIKLQNGYAIAIRRFDREAGGLRRHAISANVALTATGDDLSYPALAQFLRRRAPAHLIVEQMRELFRRMVFNILIDNTDDHEKNHALLLQNDESYILAPAFDVVPTCQSLGYQAMNVGLEGAESSIENALSDARSFGLTRAEACEQARLVAVVVEGWRRIFEDEGAPDHALDELSIYINRPYLLDQRQALLQGKF
jgi:serine/threonine-protein kinase HipA